MSGKRSQVDVQEPVYTRRELMAAAGSFGVTPETVAGALRLAGAETMTRTGAAHAIRKYMERKV